MSHIFISYSRTDQIYARRLKDYLQNQGFQVWMDDRINYGDAWFREISQAIRACGAFIVIMTPAADASEWVHKEILIAIKHEKQLKRGLIFPLLLAGEEFDILIDRHFFDVRDGNLPPQSYLETLEAVAPKDTIPAAARRWLELIENPMTEAPQRLEAGGELAALGDPRCGIGLKDNGLPDFDWVKMPGGKFYYQKTERPDIGTFYIARYPVTYPQFQVFIEDGYADKRFWEGLAQQQDSAAPQKWPSANHPRENVNWYEAMAFCRWLSFKLTGEIPVLEHARYWPVRLPTEKEWERAARGKKDRRNFPWGRDYLSGYANVDETRTNSGPYRLMRTTAVGMYPHGASPEGLLDMSGNVWEWTLSPYMVKDELALGSREGRVLRGGSFDYFDRDAKVHFRLNSFPDFRFDNIGFRVCTANLNP